MTKDELNAAIRELCEAMGMTFMPWEIRPWSAGADRDGPRHAYALALMLDLDLGETRFVEQLGNQQARKLGITPSEEDAYIRAGATCRNSCDDVKLPLSNPRFTYRLTRKA